MASFKKIAIIGVGLIGGSIGLSIKKNHAAGEVIGIFRHESTLKRALKCRAIDKGALDIASGVKDADLIIIATPVHYIPEVAAKVLKYAKTGAVITDAGSTKEWIVREIEGLAGKNKRVLFVGSHPMAGSEHTGVEFARNDLLEGSNCIVTKTPRTDKGAYNKVIGFWKKLGCKVKTMSPVEHDRTVSLISHLPHVVAFSLAGAVSEKDMESAAEGFKDTTRVAGSDPELWADIFLTNKKAIVKAGAMFNDYFKNLMRAIKGGNRNDVVRMLKYAKSKRDKFRNAKKD